MKVSWHRFIVVLIAVGVVLLLSFDVSAQCSMCRAALSSSSHAKFVQALNTGVLVLLLPPVSIFCSIFYILRKQNKETNHEQSDEMNS